MLDKNKKHQNRSNEQSSRDYREEKGKKLLIADQTSADGFIRTPATESPEAPPQDGIMDEAVGNEVEKEITPKETTESE